MKKKLTNLCWKHFGWEKHEFHRKDAGKLKKRVPKELPSFVDREHTKNILCLTVLVPPFPHRYHGKFLCWKKKNHLTA